MSGPVVFVSGGEGGGGVLSLVRDLVPATAQYLALPTVHLGLVNLPVRRRDAPGNFSVDTLSVHPDALAPGETCRRFLEWVKRVAPSVVVLNDVSQIDAAWLHLPPDVRLVVVLHDEAMRFRRPLVDGHAAVDRVVVVADYLKQLLTGDSRALGHKTVVIHNGVRFPAHIVPTTRLSFEGRELEILYVGGMDYFKKGIQDLPELARALKRRNVAFRLDIVGGRDERLAGLCSKYGVGGSIHWRGRLAMDQVLEAAARSDFFFLPSRCEPFGMVTVEAMGMGAIPFAYDIESGSREIIEHGTSGWLFRLADVEAVATGMHRLMRDEDLCRRVRRNGIDRARSVFSIDRSARKYAEVIRTVLAEPASRTRTAAPIELHGAADSAPASARSAAGRTCRAVARAVLERFPSLVQPFWRRYG